MELDVEAARAAVQTVADAMGLDSVEQAAEGIVAIVNENMAGALRLVSVQRGHDPRDFALVAYGGAGPLHANALAKLMGSFPVIVPPAPGLLCAIGDLVADFRDEFAQTYIRLLADAERRRGRRHPRRARRRARRTGSRARASPRTRSGSLYTADMRYHRQGYEIPVALDPDEVRADGLADLEERFNGLHEQLYGFRMPGTACEIVNLRAVGYGAVPKPELPVGEAGRRRRVGGGRRRARGRLRRRARADEDLRPLEARAGRRARRARRSSPSSTRRRSSSPATGPKSTRTSTS